MNQSEITKGDVAIADKAFEKEIVKEWHGLNHLQSNRWCCIQDMGNGRHWFYEPSLFYTRSQSIKYLTQGSALTWRQLKDKYGWRCSKVILTIFEISTPNK